MKARLLVDIYDTTGYAIINKGTLFDFDPDYELQLIDFDFYPLKKSDYQIIEED